MSTNRQLRRAKEQAAKKAHRASLGIKLRVVSDGTIMGTRILDQHGRTLEHVAAFTIEGRVGYAHPRLIIELNSSGELDIGTPEVEMPTPMSILDQGDVHD
jgi:hypothetical protein